MKKTFIIFLILFSPFCYGIVEKKEISLSEAIDLALSINPQIKMADIDIQNTYNDIKIASRLQNPNIHTFQNIASTALGNPQQIGVDYTLEILKRSKRKDVAKSRTKIAENNLELQKQYLILQVKKTYIDLLLKKTNLKILQEQQELLAQLLKTAQNELQKNQSDKTGVIQAKIAYNQAVMYTNIAKSEVITAQNRFNTALNSNEIDYDTKEQYLTDNYKDLLTIDPKTRTVGFDEIKNYTLTNRHDLLAAEKDVQIAELNLKTVKSNLIPDLELTGGYAYLTKGISEENNYQQGAYAGLTLTNIPLIYHYQPEIKNAKNDIEKAKLKLEDLKIDTVRNITDSWEKFTIARNNLNFYNDELLVNSNELLNVSIKSLDKKEIDLTTFLVSKKLYLELILGYYGTLAEYYISYAELLEQMNASNINIDSL